MGQELINHRPPSPPHSNNGDPGQHAGKFDQYHGPHTPPRTVRPASRAEGMSRYAHDSPSSYPPIPQQTVYTQQPTNYHNPPSIVDPGIMTRSGKSLGSPIEPKRQSDTSSRSPKPRKTRSAKSGKKGLPVIDQPLSVLTRDYQIPVRDMGMWVNRPVEDRLREVEKKKGYISRPMNSFMLYRSAYANRVKQFCKENNHQVVSQVTGQSWPMEPPYIREMYEQYAIIERDNHTAAHPTYKFAPNKSGKKRGRDDDESDSDDEWRGPGSAKRSRQGTRGDTRSLSSTPFDTDRISRFQTQPHHHHQQPQPQPQPQRQPHPSSYQDIDPRGPSPLSFEPIGMAGSYYQPHMLPYRQHMDDANFNRFDRLPFSLYDPGSQLIGMPDSSDYELLAGTEGVPEAIANHHVVDPQLAQFNPEYAYGHFDGMTGPLFQDPRTCGYSTYIPSSSMAYTVEPIHPGMVTLTDGWTEHPGAGSDFDSEFRNWG